MRRWLRSHLTYANVMVTRTRLRRTVTAVVTFLAALAFWAAPASAVSPPKVMAALGDSITRGYNSAGTEFTPGTCPMLRGNPPNPFDLDCPPNSWSTGTSPAGNSQFDRIQAIDPDRHPVAYNDAVSGARAGTDRAIDLVSQAQNAATQAPDYVTIEIGANDACRPTIADQTPTQTFRDHVGTALNDLVNADPKVYVEMASIPDMNQLYTLFNTDPNAILRWSALHTCQALLANPTSTDPTDVARRAAFRDQVIAYNGALADVCAEFNRCLFDNEAVFNVQFTAQGVANVTNTGALPGTDPWDSLQVFGTGAIPGSTADYFHPSLLGQAQLAEATWNATFSMN
jgi:lysophospholipase L1-like esterase